MKATTFMICLAWTLVGICIGVAVMGAGTLDRWMAVMLTLVFLYVLGLAIAFTRSRWHGPSFLLLREQGNRHCQKDRDRPHAHGH